MLADKIFIDSNIWIYIFCKEDNYKCQISENFIRENSLKNIIVIS